MFPDLLTHSSTHHALRLVSQQNFEVLKDFPRFVENGPDACGHARRDPSLFPVSQPLETHGKKYCMYQGCVFVLVVSSLTWRAPLSFGPLLLYTYTHARRVCSCRAGVSVHKLGGTPGVQEETKQPATRKTIPNHVAFSLAFQSPGPRQESEVKRGAGDAG